MKKGKATRLREKIHKSRQSPHGSGFEEWWKAGTSTEVPLYGEANAKKAWDEMEDRNRHWRAWCQELQVLVAEQEKQLEELEDQLAELREENAELAKQLASSLLVYR